MVKRFICYLTAVAMGAAYLFQPASSSARQNVSITSEHIQIFVPVERELLGRDLIGNIEQCYGYMNRAIDGSLPDKVFITVDWEASDSTCSRERASILLGMNQPVADIKEFFLYSAAREIAHLGLLELSQGAQRQDTEFLFKGMIEILVHEYFRSSRRLEAAWVFSKFLDEMKMLGFATQRSWSDFSENNQCLRNAAPGFTFLTTFRDLQGRRQPMKLFKALRKKSLMDSLAEAFKSPPSELEKIWLKRVREYPPVDEITTVAEEAPRLTRTEIAPNPVAPGADIRFRFFIEDRAGNLLAAGVFLRDERTGRLLQVQAASEGANAFFSAFIPVEPDCPPGQYKYQVTAIDEVGNLRRWDGKYKVDAGGPGDQQQNANVIY